MFTFPAIIIKNVRNHYTAHTNVPVDRRDNSCVWNDNSVLRKSGINFCVAHSLTHSPSDISMIAMTNMINRV